LGLASDMTGARNWRIVRSVTLAAATLLALGGSARAQITCSAFAGIPLLREEGLSEQLGDVVVICQCIMGGGCGTSVTANFTVALNTNVTSDIVDPVESESEALLLINEPPAGSQRVRRLGPPPLGDENVFTGIQAGNNRIEWNTIPFVVPPAGEPFFFRFTNLRGNVALLGLTPVQAFVSITGTTSVSITNSVVTLGVPLTSLHGEVADQGCTAGTQQVVVTVRELFASAFKKRVEVALTPDRQNVVSILYGTESGFTPDGADGNPAHLGAIGVADTGTRFVIHVPNIPAGTMLSAPPTVPSSAFDLFLQRIVDFDANFGGGTASVDPSVPISAGTAILLYEVRAGAAQSGANDIDEFAIPLTATCTGGSLDASAIDVVYAPVNFTQTASAPAPEPRFAPDISVTPPATPTPTQTSDATETPTATPTDSPPASDASPSATPTPVSPLTCVVTSMPALARAEGFAELVSDVEINCRGGDPMLGDQLVNVDALLNTNVTSDILDESSGESEALLLLSTCSAPSCPPTGAPMPGMQLVRRVGAPLLPAHNAFTAQRTDGFPRRLTWTGIPLRIPGPTGQFVYRITNLRGNAAQAGSGGQMALTVAISPQQGPTLATAVVVVAAVASSLDVTVDDMGCAANNQQQVIVTFAEQFNTAFRKRIEVNEATQRQNVVGEHYDTESGFTPDGVFGEPSDLADIGVADTGTRFVVVLSGLPSGAMLTAPATVPSGMSGLFLQRIAGWNADFAGGTATSDTTVMVSGGVATLLYEVRAADTTTGGTALDSFALPLVAACAGSPTIDAAKVHGGYAPGNGTSVMSKAAPEPRFAEPPPPVPTATATRTSTATVTATASATATAASTGTATATRTAASALREVDVPGGCTDGVDNDADGVTDCADPDCTNTADCPRASPAISPVGLVAAVLLLVALAFYRMRRWREERD
jgi:hypothetical protein